MSGKYFLFLTLLTIGIGITISTESYSVEIEKGVESILDDEDKAFLSKIKTIKKCVDPLWMPMEAIDENNQHVGIIADVLDLVEEQIGTPINLVSTVNWSESLDKLKSRECDIVTSDAATGVTPDYYIKTAPFLEQKIVYVIRKEVPFQLDFSLIKDKTIGIPKGYPIIDLIKKQYGEVNIVEVADVNEGILKVSRGELFAFADILSVCSYSIQSQGLTNLKVGGHINIPTTPVVMAVRSDMPQLVAILNKALLTIDNSTINGFLANWIKVEYDAKVDWSEYYNYLLIGIFMLGAILYWNRKLHQLNRKLDKANLELAFMNEIDTLTQTKNRNFLTNQVPQLVKLAKRHHLSLGVAMLDIDHFKQLNDTFGHAVGDKCLIDFADTIKNVFRRDSDWVIRFGGEEFVVICIGMEKDAYIQKLESFRKHVEKSKFPLETGEIVTFTVSIGYEFHPQTLDEWSEKYLVNADEKLYEAKQAGRNQIIGSIIDSD